MIMSQEKLRGSTLRKRRLQLLQNTLARARMDLALGKLPSLMDILKFLGENPEDYPNGELTRRYSIHEFNILIAQPLEDRLRRKLGEEADAERIGLAQPEIVDELPADLSNKDPLDIGHHAAHPLDKTDWALQSQHACTLFPHQSKAAKDLIWKFHVENHRCSLLQGGVGVGKTYIYGKVIAEHWHRNWFRGRTFSPWPVLIITKASIVEQTSRVMLNDFGLNKRQFKVLNYDALRSSKGLETVINWEWIVKNGERVKHLSWKPGLEPILVIVDECQSAKNNDSQQSKVVQSLAEIKNPHLKIIFSSATPWTRVIEAKYFAVNTHIEYKLI